MIRFNFVTVMYLGYIGTLKKKTETAAQKKLCDPPTQEEKIKKNKKNSM